MAEWISVYDRLPEKGQKVIVLGMKNRMQIGIFRGAFKSTGDTMWAWKKNSYLIVTHWMPLPEPPVDESEGDAD